MQGGHVSTCNYIEHVLVNTSVGQLCGCISLTWLPRSASKEELEKLINNAQPVAE